MRDRIKSSVLLLGLMACGCATPMEKAYTRRVLFNQAVAEGNSLRSAKRIADSTFADIVAAEDIASSVLDIEDEAAKSGNSITFWQAYNAAGPKLTEVLLRLSTAKGK